MNRKLAILLVALACVAGAGRRLWSESLVLSTSYPAPVGVYNQLVTTGDSGAQPANTTLNRNKGHTLLVPPSNPTGQVGIGTSNPGAKLDVVGSGRVSGDWNAGGIVQAGGLRLPSGAGAGRVLTSDAAGNASWQQPAAGLSCVTRSATTPSPPNYAYSSVSCQGAERATGGGCTVDGDCGNARVFGSFPNGPASWACATAGCATAKTAWVVCCQ